jgi:Asp-tRNA(Asn)/Glu-tRNA(Gln) amidotransferase A subunit family amidase
LAEGGLPVGLQVIGRRFADEQVISLSSKLELVRPWLADLQAAVERLDARAQKGVRTR